MSSKGDPVKITMIERNPNNLPGKGTSYPKTLPGEVVLSFHNISYQETVSGEFPFCKKTLVIERLSNISGIMKPGLNAIMGPQDRSRSLLLDVLAARNDPHGFSGDILINGKPRPTNFKCNSGYVPQNDTVMSTVTVRENVEFSAALRLPLSITRDEKRRRINDVLKLLHLDEESNVKPRSKELRKRTSIAMELVAEHPILFLDDPTTALDLRTTIDVISVLRRMSMRGRTIIFSIKQPPYSIFKCFDSLTLVASGKVMFHGPAQEALEYFTSAGYNYDPHNNPADFFLDIITGGFSAILDTEEDDHEADKYKELCERTYQVTKKLTNMFAQSSLYNKMRSELDPLLGEQKAGRSPALEEITCATPFWHQLWWIISRSFKNFLGFSWVTMIQAIVEVMVAIFVGTTFNFLQNNCYEAQRRLNLIFLLTVNECIISMSARDLFMTDRNCFVHEHSSGYYRVPSYFFGKLLGDLVPRRLLPLLFYYIHFYTIQYNANGFFTMLFTIMMLAYSSNSLLISLGAGKNAVAVPRLLVTFYFVSMLFFSGLEIYSGILLPGISSIQYFSIPHYGFTALLQNEFFGKRFCPEHNRTEISSCQRYVICTGEEFLMIQGIDLSPWGFWQNHVALACIMIILLSITYIQLLKQKKVEVLRIDWRMFQQLLKEK
ncbi:ATP-binding cassette sub-family G member 3-like [Mesocricetus auratus]|uniref:ATP-binding cassette sub-family G member 3-like n=1 Tax=Mesocricetus auratus TaxID=10036 RepID=A0ABM2XL72_MESAU|nr:ATP-binding cassette sub-family G member 3-like [Mesocricetus auratus]